MTDRYIISLNNLFRNKQIVLLKLLSLVFFSKIGNAADHRLIKMQIEHWMPSFQDLGVFLSQILQDRERACSTSFGLLPQGYCEQKTPES